MLSQIHRLHTELGVQVAPITYRNSHCSSCGVFWRFVNWVNYSCLNCIFHAIQLRIIFHGESQCNLTTNYIDLLLVFPAEFTQKKQVKQLAETKYDELRKLFMLRHKKPKKLSPSYYSTVNRSELGKLSQNPLGCKFCQSVNLKIEGGNQLSIKSGTQTSAHLVEINYTSICVEV